MANTVKIFIGSEFDGRGFDGADRRFRELSGAAKEFIDTLKMGVGIDLGGRLVQSLAEVPALLQHAIANGVRLNAELETTRLTIAGMVKQAGGLESLNAGLSVSDQLIAKMRTSANELGLSFEAMLETYKTTAGALFNAGVTDLQKQLDLTTLLQRAMTGLGISGFQATRDIQDILTGMAGRTKAGRELGIRDEDVKAAEHAGRVYEYLTEKLSGIGEAGAAGVHTFNAESNRLENQIQALEREISKPIFDALTVGMAELSEELKKPEVAQSLKEIGIEIAEIVKEGTAMLVWAVQNVELLKALALATGIFGAALAAIKISEVVFGLGLWLQGLRTSTAATASSTSAIESETAALARNTGAQAQNAAARTARAASASPWLSPGTVPMSALAPTQRGKATSENYPTAVRETRAFNRALDAAIDEQRLSPAEYLAQQKQVRQGSTTFARYQGDGSGGVTGPAFSAAVPVVSTGGAGGGGSGIGASAMGIAGGFAVAGLFEAILHLIDGLNQLRLAYKESEATRKSDDRDNSDKIRSKLTDVAKETRPGGQDELQRMVGAERVRLQSMLANEKDPDQQRRLRENIERLNDVLLEGDVAQRKNMEADAIANAADARERKEAQEREQEIDHQVYLQEQAKKFEEVGQAVTDSQLQGANPAEKLKLLQGLAMQERAKYATAIDPRIAGLDPSTATPEAMMAAAPKSIDVAGTPGSSEALAAAKKLSEILREIAKLNEDAEKAVEEECVKEGELAEKKQRTRDELAREKDILVALAAGDTAAAVAAERRKAIETEILSLVAQHIDASEARKIAEEGAALKAEASRHTALKDLQEQHEIETARVAGNVRLVEELQRQRDIEREIKQLEQSGLSAAEAREQATRAADDKDAVRNQDRAEKLEQINADDAVGREQAHHHKTGARKAGDKAFELKRRHELEHDGYDQETIDRTVGGELATRRRSQGGIGGPTGRAGAADKFGKGGMSDDDWAKTFGKTTSDGTREGGESNHGSVAGGRGLTPDAAWDKLFPRALGDVTPEPSNRPGGDAAAGAAATAKGDGATEAVQKAGTDGQAAAKSLKTAAQGVQKSMEALQATAVSDLGATAGKVDELKGTLESKIQELNAKIDAAINAIGAA